MSAPALRRVGHRPLAALGLSAALVLATPWTASAAPQVVDNLRVPTPPDAAKMLDEPGDLAVASKPRRGDKLGQRDREALAEAQSSGRSTVTVLIATSKGSAPAVAAGVAKMGGSVGYRNDDLGYVRAQVPTKAVERTAKMRGVFGVDLNEQVQLPDPRPARAGSSAAPTAAAAPAPGQTTPATNPYLPTNEIGATDFVRDHPEWDGRGVTIGVLDSGVDLDHPSLQTASTGQRKIVDWVTATDPLVDGDESWRPMLRGFRGPSFTYAGRTWTTPRGYFRINEFAESVTAGSEYEGDVNRDGDDTDTWGVLYRPATNDVWVDTDDDGDFTDEELRRPYNEQFQVGHFGTDRPRTAVQESVPFVVEFREDVDLSPAGLDGRVADFVNIGIVADAHGSHVAGIAAGNNLFGGKMDGGAPGAKIVSSRACVFAGGCTSVALIEGMIDLVANRRVDVVNMSIGGLPALNDGNNTRATIYNRLIADYGVQMFFSAGNEGPGINSVGDPSVVSNAVSVAASISKGTWQANYGSRVSAEHQLINFSSRGPSEDGDVKPNISAPGSAISTVPLWQEGSPVPEAGYELPPGYAMFNGTSMSSPQAAGGAALLLSAGLANDVSVTPPQLRTAIYSSAEFDPAISSYGQGVGEMQVGRAWSLLSSDALSAGRYDISAGVCTPLSQYLLPPARGTGIYNRCPARAGGQAPGSSKTYEVKVTRRSGPAGNVVHRLRWLGNDGTFSAPNSVALPLGTPVTVKVTAKPTAGAHGALLRIDNASTRGVDAWMQSVVVASTPLSAPDFSWSDESRVERNRMTSYFITVPEGAEALQVNLSGIAPNSQTRFLAFHPYGISIEDNSSPNCYTSYSDEEACNPRSRTYTDPTPGVWELVVEARRTTPYLSNPFQLSASVQGVALEPEVIEVASARAGQEVPLSWALRNRFAPVTVQAEAGELGSATTARPDIATNETDEFTVDVPDGATRLDVSIGNPSDLGADLDLAVLLDGVLVGASAGGDSEEFVSIADPTPGTYTVQVFGYDVPAGTTEYDYRDVYYAGGLGSVDVDGSVVALDQGETATLTGSVTPEAAPGEGRQLFGEVTLTEADSGALVGSGGVVVREVLP